MTDPDRALANDAVTEHIPLKPDVFAILLVVLQQPAHGYAIMQKAREQASGGRELQPGALYRLLKRMLGDGLLDEVDAPRGADDDDPRRRYYRATELGRSVAAAEAQRMQELVTAGPIQDLLAEGRSV